MIPLIAIVIAALVGFCILFYIRRRSVEGFGAFQDESKRFADKQFTYFHDTAGKGIFTNSGLNLSQFNSAVKSPDLYVPTSLDRDYTSYFVEDPESAFSEKDKAFCRSASHPRFLPVRERKSSVACGWWFVSDPTIPSVGVLGTRDGPVFHDMVGGGEWIWDINLAAQKEDIKRCKSITSCDLMDLPGIAGECGFCESNGYAVPIDSSGRVKYPESETGSCGEDTKNTADRCSKPEPPPYTTDNGIFCGIAGRPSPDGRTRVYTADECSALGGSLQAGGNCMRSDGGSFSDDCAPLNSPTYAASALPPNVCEPTAQGRLTKACLSSLILNLGYSKAGSIYMMLNSSNPPNVTDKEAIAVLQKAGVSVPDSILGSGAIDLKSAGTLYKKILDTTYTGASSQIKEAARWLAVGSDAFDACDYAVGQPGPFGANCLQRAFRSAGCQASGAKNPNEKTAPLYANMTWAEVNTKFTSLFAATKSGDADAQDEAMRDCLGISYLRKPIKSCDWTEVAIKGNWILDPAGGSRLNTIAICDDESIIGTNLSQQIWRKTNVYGMFSQMPGALVQVDAKSSTLIVGVNAGGFIYQWINNNWTRIGERAKWASIGSDGTIVCVNNENGTLWRYLGRPDAWENITGIAAQISVGNRNTMWCVNIYKQIFKWTGTGWILIPGALSRVAVSSGGKIAGIGLSDTIWVYSDNISNWKQVPGGASNISISEKYIACTNASSMIYYLKL